MIKLSYQDRLILPGLAAFTAFAGFMTYAGWTTKTPERALAWLAALGGWVMVGMIAVGYMRVRRSTASSDLANGTAKKTTLASKKVYRSLVIVAVILSVFFSIKLIEGILDERILINWLILTLLSGSSIAIFGRKLRGTDD